MAMSSAVAVVVVIDRHVTGSSEGRDGRLPFDLLITRSSSTAEDGSVDLTVTVVVAGNRHVVD